VWAPGKKGLQEGGQGEQDEGGQGDGEDLGGQADGMGSVGRCTRQINKVLSTMFYQLFLPHPVPVVPSKESKEL
jgi:hypothetical protein